MKKKVTSFLTSVLVATVIVFSTDMTFATEKIKTSRQIKPPVGPSAFACFQSPVLALNKRFSFFGKRKVKEVIDEENKIAIALPETTLFPSCIDSDSSPSAATLPSGHACAGNSSISKAIDHCITVCAEGTTCTSSDGFWSCKCN